MSTNHDLFPTSTGKASGHPVMFGTDHAKHFGPFPDGGGFPHGFLKMAFKDLGVTDYNLVLHLCSGSVLSGVTVDIRPSMKPSVVADVTSLPFGDETFKWIIADPPYSEMYAENLYGTGDSYPKPLHIMSEMLRILEPGGRCGFLHHQVPFFRKPLEMLLVRGISLGLGFNLKAWSVFEKPLENKELFND